ncbi:MAG: hypothetical protein ACKVQQ_01435 [Burkholderiales bacterium]
MARLSSGAKIPLAAGLAAIRARVAYRGPAKPIDATIAASIRELLDLENIDAAEPALISRALDACEAGIDFADALHAAQCAAGETFATFDKTSAKRAGKAGRAEVMLISG